MNNYVFLALLTALPFTAIAEEKTADVPSPTKLVCHGPHEERTLHMSANGNGCVLTYTKGKETKEVARAQNDSKPCQQTMQKIRDRLESGNFACE